jgi:hypothetical protein
MYISIVIPCTIRNIQGQGNIKLAEPDIPKVAMIVKTGSEISLYILLSSGSSVRAIGSQGY